MITAANGQQDFVFGYTATIFRDDETAKAIDHGRFLVPCMTDSELLLDRYDGGVDAVERLRGEDE